MPPPRPFGPGYLVHRIERLFERHIESRLADQGISFSGFHFLRLLMRQDGVTHKHLSQASGLTQSSVACAMKALETQGLVSRTRGTADKREVFVHLTDSANDLRPLLNRVAAEMNQLALSRLSKAEAQELGRLLHSVIEGLSADSSEG